MGKSDTVDGFWKATSVRLRYMDPTTPGLVVSDTTADIDFPIEDSVLDRGSFDRLIEIDGPLIRTYTHFEGEGVYFQVTQEFFCLSPQLCFVTAGPVVDVFGANGPDASDTYALVDGRLVERIIYSPVDPDKPLIFIQADVKHGFYSGRFPPAGWPNEKVELN